MTPDRTTRNLKSQHPSWNIDTAVLLGRIVRNSTKWKQASTKLILITNERPKQAALFSISRSLQSISLGMTAVIS